MATITISCPKCENTIKLPPELEGKKIRCKECTHVFVVKVPAGAKAAAKTAKAAKPEAKGAKPAKEKQAAAKAPAEGDEDDDGGKAYAVTENSFLPRCAYCAKEMESEEQVVCLNCGYNHRTRVRIETEKTYDPTGGEWFIHLLPGLLCALAVLLMIGAIVFYWVVFPRWAEGEEWWTIVFGLAGRIWMTIISLFIAFFTGKYAVKRLFINYRPVERKMVARKKD